MHLIMARCDPSWWVDLRACLPCLVQLAETAADQSIHRLRPQIDMILREHCDGSDRPEPIPDPHSLSRQVDRVLAALRQYRLEAHCLDAGDRSGTAVPPLMFG